MPARGRQIDLETLAAERYTPALFVFSHHSLPYGGRFRERTRLPWVEAGRQREPLGRGCCRDHFGLGRQRMRGTADDHPHQSAGALVYVDDNEVGLTPVAISPIYYGNRKIRLVKDGYETQEFIQSVPPPWYEIPPLDFFSENVVPGKIRDVRTYDYQLYPQTVVPQEDLLTKAEGLRRGTQTGHRCARLSGQPAVARPDLRAGPGNPRRAPDWRPATKSTSTRDAWPCHAARTDLHAAARHRAVRSAARRANLPAAALNADGALGRRFAAVSSAAFRRLRL